MKRVYKYGTGEPIPEGAIYLSTQVETETTPPNHNQYSSLDKGYVTRNLLVWHYFLVDPPEALPPAKGVE